MDCSWPGFSIPGRAHEFWTWNISSLDPGWGSVCWGEHSLCLAPQSVRWKLKTSVLCLTSHFLENCSLRAGMMSLKHSYIFWMNKESLATLSGVGIFIFPSLYFYLFVPKFHMCVIQFSSLAKSCPTLWNPMDCSMPGFSVHPQLLELAQTHVHRVGDSIQPSYPLLSPSPTAFSLSQHQGLF